MDPRDRARDLAYALADHLDSSGEKYALVQSATDLLGCKSITRDGIRSLLRRLEASGFLGKAGLHGRPLLRGTPSYAACLNRARVWLASRLSSARSSSRRRRENEGEEECDDEGQVERNMRAALPFTQTPPTISDTHAPRPPSSTRNLAGTKHARGDEHDDVDDGAFLRMPVAKRIAIQHQLTRGAIHS
jgi:hypothetical protein